MRAVVSRVTSASCVVDGVTIGSIQSGLLVLVAAGVNSTAKDAQRLADRVSGMRIFSDGEGKMNLALPENGELLVISNFTLFGDAWASRRPSFIKAAPYEIGERLYVEFIETLKAKGLKVATGVFGADMKVESINDGPVTLVIETP
jgi:D-tyrosyl-tRNA(Tyr) deacylase